MARSFWLGVLVLALYAFYGWRPFVIQTWTVVDDGLYVRHALGFLHWLDGKGAGWLGPYDCFLLAKVPLYGVWLGCLNVLGVPLRVADFALFVGAAFLLRRAVRPVRALRTWEFAVVLFLLVANPALPEDYYLRRITFHIALIALCLAAAIGLALRADATARRQWPWALLTGFCFSLCYLNREEAIWVVAAVGVAFFIVAGTSFFAWRRGALERRAAVKVPVVVGLAFFAGFVPLVTAVCALNWEYYGVFQTTSRRSPALTSLMQRLTSLEPAGHQRYIPIARPTRLKAYELSPTFARLMPYLEGSTGYWRAGNAEHAVSNGHKPEDREVFVSYFEFALLSAASDAGLKRADQIEAIFRVIDRELGEAVRSGKIAAGASGPAILAAPVAGDYGRIVGAFFLSLSEVLFVKNGGYEWPAGGARISHDKIEEAANVTLANVVPEAAPNLHQAMRRPVVIGIKLLQRVLFPLFFVAVAVLAIWRRRELRTTQPSPATLLLWALAIPLAALCACCLSMAVVEVLGFQFLALMAYNVLGYAPLSVLCALSFVSWRVFAPGRRRARAMVPEAEPAR